VVKRNEKSYTSFFRLDRLRDDPWMIACWQDRNHKLRSSIFCYTTVFISSSSLRIL
jgi:hypothetical protein